MRAILIFRFNTNFEKNPPLAHKNPLLKDNRTVLLDSLIGQPYWTVLLDNLIGQPSYALTYTVGTREVDVSGGHPPIDYRVK